MILPTSYFPSILYFQYLLKNPTFSICENETYLKQSFRNRCEIMTSNGIQKLSIPVEKLNGSKSKTKEVMISNQQNWRKDHWGAIESAYKASPFFQFYDKEVKDLIFNNTENLISFNQKILVQLISWWDLPVKQNNNDSSIYDKQIDFLSRTPVTPYTQVFHEKLPFVSNLSVLDLLFCEGPMGRKWFVDYSK